MTNDDKLTETVKQQVAALPEGDAASLSKVLFPDTHTDKVTLLGKERTLKPVPVKIARQINAATVAIANRINAAFAGDGSIAEDQLNKPLDEPVTTALMTVTKVLADYYEWLDVKFAAESEDLTLTEVQALAVTQVRLNENNDFLLSPLRTLIASLQIIEILGMHFRSTLTSLHSSSPGTVASMS